MRIIHFTEYSHSYGEMKVTTLCGQTVITLKPNGFDTDRNAYPICDYCHVIERLEGAAWYVVSEENT